MKQTPEAKERERIVAWLRQQPKLLQISGEHVRANCPQRLANQIEALAHLNPGQEG